MTSPGGQEVGRVSIRVVPDTSKFRRTLERDLKKIQKSMRVEIPVDLDMKGIRTQIAAIRRMLESMRGANIPVNLDDRVTENMRRITTQARTLNGAVAGLGNQFKRFGRVAGRATDDVRIRMMLFGGVLRRAFTTNPFRTLGRSITATGRGIRNLGRGIANLDLSFRRVRRSSVLFVQTLTQGVALLGKGLMTPLTGIFKAFAGLNRVGWITVAVLAAIPPLLGLIAGLLAGLPSLVAAFGVAAGVIALGVDGIKAAFEGFNEQIEETRNMLSGVFEEGFTPIAEKFAAVINKMAPQLKLVAEGIIEMANGFTDAVTSAQGLENTRILLENIGSFFTSMRPVMEQFTSTFLFMAAEGSKHFGLLTDTFSKFATEFDNMIKESVRLGEFEAGLVGLNKVLDSLLQGFTKLVDVGIVAMGELGGPFADALTSLIDLIVAMMPALTAFSVAVLDVIGALAESLIPVFQTLSPLFESFFQEIAGLLIPVIKALAPPLQEIIRFAIQLFHAFSPLFPVITQIAQILGNVLMTALRALQPVLPIIADAMAEVAQVIGVALKAATPVLHEIAGALGKAIVDAIKALAPHLPTIIKAFLDLVIAVLPLLPPLIELASAILPILINVISILIPPILNLARAFIDWIMPAARGVIDIFRNVISWLGDLAVGVANAGKSVINWFRDLPGKLWGFVKDAGSWLFNAGKNIVTGLWNGIVDMWNRMVGWLGDLLNGLVSQVTGILQINSPSRVFHNIGEFVMQGFQLGIEDAAPDAIASVTDVAKQVAGIGGDMSTEVSASGGMTLMSDNIEGAIARGIEGWTFELDKFGVGRLNRSAERDNKFGR